MQKIKLSELNEDDIILVEGETIVNRVSDITDDLDYYKEHEVYTTIKKLVNFNAEDMLRDTIEYIYENGEMYEDWDETITREITIDEINQLQEVLDKIVNNHRSTNTAYMIDKEIEID